MKRTSVLLPDDIAKLLKLEAERRGVTPSLVIREAVATYVAGPSTKPRELKFANLFTGEVDSEFSADRLEEYLAKHYAEDLRRRNWT